MTTGERALPLVSVIVPVYNGERFLAGAIRTVLEQEYARREIIVVDDGSTDATARIAAQFGNDIRYVRQPNRGPAAARNTGIRMAQGEVIAFLDVDDAWPRRKLQRQVSYLTTHPEVDIVQGLIVQMELDPEASNTELVFEESTEPYQFVNLGSAVYRKEVFQKVGPFDEELPENEDMDWYLRAWELSVPKAVQDGVGLHYRRHGANLTLSQSLPQMRIVKMFKRHLDRYREQGRSAQDKPADLPDVGRYIGSAPIEARKMRVRDDRFSLIANDCWGGDLYGYMNLMYRTPFVGTRIPAPCYLELLKNPREYLESPLEFVDVSRYQYMNDQRAGGLGSYPIALLHGTVEVHFIHEEDAESAQQKWERRRVKMEWDNLYLKFSQDPWICEDRHLEEFDRLSYPYKVCFTYRDYPHLRSTITIPEYFEIGAPMYFLSLRYFDSLGWLNKSNGPDTQSYRRSGHVARSRAG